ncbi:MAG: HEPN domain-containing protein [Elusimicrobiota bacterium]
MEEKLFGQIKAMINKSQRSLEDAKILFKEKRYESSSSRAYYSIFHIMQAVLLTKGLSFSKHSGVISGFSQHFIKTDIFPKEFAEIIDKLREDRENGDYDYEIIIDEKTAEEDIKNAEKIISVTTGYINKFTKI